MLKEIDIPRNKIIDTLSNPERVTGFVSPAEDYKQRRLHIAQKIVSDPTNTHYFEVSSNDMRYFGILNKSILVVDKSISVKSGRIIVCNLSGQWLVRMLVEKGDQKYLCINDGLIGSVEVTNKSIDVFGCVTWACLPL